jgi:hypothetical protein
VFTDNNNRNRHTQTKAAQDHTIKSSVSTYNGSASYEQGQHPHNKGRCEHIQMRVCRHGWTTVHAHAQIRVHAGTNKGACRHKWTGVVSRKEHDWAPILRINNSLCKWIAQSRKLHQNISHDSHHSEMPTSSTSGRSQNGNNNQTGIPHLTGASCMFPHIAYTCKYLSALFLTTQDIY